MIARDFGRGRVGQRGQESRADGAERGGRVGAGQRFQGGGGGGQVVGLG